jgi:fucose permease
MKKSKTKRSKNVDQVALVLARGAVSLVLIIAIGSFGRSFYLAIATKGHQNFPISENATQLITALGSALVGGAVGSVGGTQTQEKRDEDE